MADRVIRPLRSQRRGDPDVPSSSSRRKLSSVSGMAAVMLCLFARITSDQQGVDPMRLTASRFEALLPMQRVLRVAGDDI